jgi:hypothetical protein
MKPPVHKKIREQVERNKSHECPGGNPESIIPILAFQRPDPAFRDDFCRRLPQKEFKNEIIEEITYY